jgi:hypothetical protein
LLAFSCLLDFDCLFLLACLIASFKARRGISCRLKPLNEEAKTTKVKFKGKILRYALNDVGSLTLRPNFIKRVLPDARPFA